MAEPGARAGEGSRPRTVLGTFGIAAYTHVIPCCFVGTFSFYYLSPLLFGDLVVEDLLRYHRVGMVLLLNGGGVALGTWGWHLWLEALEARGRPFFRRRATGPLYRVCGTVVGFLCGTFDVPLLLLPWGIAVIAAGTAGLLVLHVRSFFRMAVRLLNPVREATWRDVGELIHLYGVTVAAFTLSLVSVGVFHEIVGGGSAFQAPGGRMDLLDALYFTIVVMTTLGFGDIYPLTPMGKIVVGLLCMTSYVMLALMLGIVTGGIGSGEGGPEDGGRDGKGEGRGP